MTLVSLTDCCHLLAIDPRDPQTIIPVPTNLRIDVNNADAASLCALPGIGPNLASYGSRGRSGSLVAFGQDQNQQAMTELGQAAQIETQRENQNKVAKAEAKQGNQALGSTLGGLAGGAAAGAMYGSSAGPWGTVIGGVIGALAGGLFD